MRQWPALPAARTGEGAWELQTAMGFFLPHTLSFFSDQNCWNM